MTGQNMMMNVCGGELVVCIHGNHMHCLCSTALRIAGSYDLIK
jgi:hypothetical protein